MYTVIGVRNGSSGSTGAMRYLRYPMLGQLQALLKPWIIYQYTRCVSSGTLANLPSAWWCSIKHPDPLQVVICSAHFFLIIH